MDNSSTDKTPMTLLALFFGVILGWITFPFVFFFVYGGAQ